MSGSDFFLSPSSSSVTLGISNQSTINNYFGIYKHFLLHNFEYCSVISAVFREFRKGIQVIKLYTKCLFGKFSVKRL